MNEIVPNIGAADDVHLRWMREAMRMVRADPILGSWISLQPNNNTRRKRQWQQRKSQ